MPVTRAEQIAHVGCGDLDAMGQCPICNAIRAALAAPPASDIPRCDTCGRPWTAKVSAVAGRIVCRACAAQAPPASDAPGLVANWQPIETAPINKAVLIGGGGCRRVHENVQREYAGVGRCWGGLGDKQQPTHWMPLPASPETPE